MNIIQLIATISSTGRAYNFFICFMFDCDFVYQCTALSDEPVILVN